MFGQVDWGAVAFVWGVIVTASQLVSTVVLFMLKKQAQGFQAQAATTTAIQDVDKHLRKAIDDQTDQLRGELDTKIGAVQTEVEKLESGDRQLERRVVVLEQALAHAPKARDLADLRQEISNLGTQVARFEGSQAEQNRVLRMIHEFLMEKGR